MNNNLDSIRNVGMPSIRGTAKSNTKSKVSGTGKSFVDVLQRQRDISKLTFSKHANSRLETRNIKLSESQLGRLDESIKIAQSKGIKDSLVIMDDLSFVVNVKNLTVITALNNEEAKEKVFTNIDGAVII